MSEQQAIQEFLQEWAPRKEIVAASKSDSKSAWSSCLVVVSSASGSGRAARLAPRIAKQLSESYYQKVVVVPTEHKGHTQEIFREEPNLARYDLAVVVGGDGAFSEAVNGMLSRSDGQKVPLAHYPGGSVGAICGNTLGFWNTSEDETSSLHKICKLLGTRKLQTIDVNKIECADGETRYSTLVLSGGNNADICRVSDDYRWTYSWFGPSFRYVLGFFLALYKFGKTDADRKLRVTIDDEAPVEMPAFGFSLYNCGRTTPDAAFSTTQLDSGSLGFVAAQRYLGFLDHLRFMKAAKAAKEGREVPNLYTRENVRSIKVEPVSPNQEASSTTARPCYLGFDGETINGTDGNRLAVPFSARVLPKEIEVVVA